VNAYNLAARVGQANNSNATTLLDPGAGGTVIVANKGLSVLKLISGTGARTLNSAAQSSVNDVVLVVSSVASATVNSVAIEDGGWQLYRVTLDASGTNQWSLVASSALALSLTRAASFPTVTATTETATITAAQVLGGVLSGTPVSAATYTLPTAALLVAAVSGAKVGDVIRFIVSNNGADTDLITVASGSGGTDDGTMTVAQNAVREFLIRLDNVSSGTEAYTTYGIV